jgi:hypothetical protein
LARNIQKDVKQRKRNVQGRKEEEIEDGTEEVNKEVNTKRKGIEILRRQGENKEMRSDRNEGWDEGSRRREEGS